MKRIAGLSLTVASIIIMSSPTYAFPIDDFGRLLGEGAERVKPVVEKVGMAAAMEAAEGSSISEDSGNPIPVVVGGAILAVMTYGIYQAIKGRR